jgi:hypothetical protein
MLFPVSQKERIMTPLHSSVLQIWGWAALVLLGGAAPVFAQDKAYLKAYPVPAGDAEAVAKSLQESYKAITGVRIIAAGSNAVLVNAGPDEQAKIAKQLTSRTDEARQTRQSEPAAIDKIEPRIYPLKYVQASQAARTLRDLLGDAVGPKAGIRISVDERANSLVVIAGAAVNQNRVESILRALDIADARQKKEPSSVELHVRVFWLVSGALRKEAPGLPDNLRDLAAELQKLGMERPRVASQVSVSTVCDKPFEVSGMANLDAPFRLSVSGNASEKGDKIGLGLTVSAAPQGRNARSGANLRTQVTVKPGKPFVLGAAPSETLASAFVVEVVHKEPISPPVAKRSTFEFRNKPWPAVLEWLADQTGLYFTGDRPTGTFTFIPTAGKSFTIPEIIDILNEALAGQQLLIVRREQSFTIVPSDKKIDPSLTSRISPEDLDKRGKTELVSMIVPLHSLNVEDVAPEIKKMLGPFGDLVILQKANQLLLQDTAGNLQRVYQAIKDVESRGKR